MGRRVVLVCISHLEKCTFLPDPLWNELCSFNGRVHYLPSDSVTPAEFLKVLDTLRPDVLVTAWSTPRLPSEPEECDRILGYLKKITHLAGSLNGFPRCYLESGLVMTNWGASISRTVAECALMLILCSLRETARCQLEMHLERGYKQTPSFLSLFERRVGIFVGSVPAALGMFLSTRGKYCSR